MALPLRSAWSLETAGITWEIAAIGQLRETRMVAYDQHMKSLKTLGLNRAVTSMSGDLWLGPGSSVCLWVLLSHSLSFSLTHVLGDPWLMAF